MRNRSLLITAATVVMGSFVLPVAVSAASTTTPPPRLTLAPAFALVQQGTGEVTFTLVNTGTQAVHVKVTASDAWIVPSETSFDLTGNARHELTAAVHVPSSHDAGDHESDLRFSVPPASPSGTLNVTLALESRVIITTAGVVTRGLRIGGLTLPAFVDSFDNPTVNLTIANSGNTYRIVDVPPFGQVLVLRGERKTLSLQWRHHRWIGLDSISAGGSTASTFFFPIRISTGLLVLLAGLGLMVIIRRRRSTTARPVG